MTGHRRRRQTKHRVAVSKLEVRVLIDDLRQKWSNRRANPEECRRALKELVEEKHCTIRGLAGDLGVKEQTLRYRYHLARPKKVAAKAKPAPAKQVQTKSALARHSQTPAGSVLPASEKKAPPQAGPERTAQTSDQSRSTQPTGRKKSPKIEERFQTLESLQGQLAEIIVNLIRTELGEKSTEPRVLREVLAMASKHMSGRYQEWAFRELPSEIPEGSLPFLTRPHHGSPSESKTEYVGRWIATMLNSVIFTGPGTKSRILRETERLF